MNKAEKIKKLVEANKELKRNMKELHHFGTDEFIMNAQRYIKAIKEGRMMCSIDKVSTSGMSRTLRFMEMDGNRKDGHRVYNFYALFDVLGFQKAGDYFRVHGCGMDMVFHTNYTIIHNLYTLGFMTKKECDVLAQKTPHLV